MNGPVVTVFGGAGFVGANLVHRLLARGDSVRIVDNLSRSGVQKNIDWLQHQHGDRFELLVGDIRDASIVRRAITDSTCVFHLAAQVAVTTSLVDPVADFEINVRGTLNVLEAIRNSPRHPPLIFTSTNKVYGALEDVALEEAGRRYRPLDRSIRMHGVAENRPLAFYSPYGCSKGAADQYVIDYARSYGLRAAVFRMSCIYGPHQFGNEDQGWVAHFLSRAHKGEPICIYGTGKQVRDLLFIDDLVDALFAAQRNIDEVSGRAFNIGGGAKNTISLLELLDEIETLDGRAPVVTFGPLRTGDQPYYVSDHRDFGRATGWEPRTSVSAGLRDLYLWMRSSRERRASAPALENRS